MADAPDHGPAQPPGERSPGERSRPYGGLARFEAGFERLLALSRIVVLVPVVVLVLSGMGAFAYGTDVFVSSMSTVFATPLPVRNQVGVFLIEIDLFLVGATLIIAAFGFYELFISRIEPAERQTGLPAWLAMRDLNDLKARVISMLILVAAVTFVDVVLDFHNGVDTLYLGVGVAVVIVALTAFLRFGSQDGRRRR